jgi:hypothetical protein
MKRLETVRNGGRSGTLVTQKRSGKVRNVGQSETSAKSRSQLLLEQSILYLLQVKLSR